ncbi:hypothetical protein CIPAW_14G131600 [Carya illinoinensis]|uniref:Lipoxygenase domain-containing protein n=1 Tax=Carya illinoinensis TaxID=32201 RepID=A0A8T1NMJ5_CARIL|nr:hypothetical protein CIPAW_14G131600 [Carya illinoinensis]
MSKILFEQETYKKMNQLGRSFEIYKSYICLSSVSFPVFSTVFKPSRSCFICQNIPVLIYPQEFPSSSKLDGKIYGDQTSTITKEHIEKYLNGLTIDEVIVLILTSQKSYSYSIANKYAKECLSQHLIQKFPKC